MLLMLLSSMDWQKPVLSSNMNEYSSIQTYKRSHSAEQHHYAEFLTFLFSHFCLFVAESELNVAWAQSQHYSTSVSPGLGNVYESAQWKQDKKVLSKRPLWPNPCRAPAVFELFAWPRYERGLCWTVEPRDTGACVCTCWCVCALDVFMETGWKMQGGGGGVVERG